MPFLPIAVGRRLFPSFSCGTKFVLFFPPFPFFSRHTRTEDARASLKVGPPSTTRKFFSLPTVERTSLLRLLRMVGAYRYLIFSPLKSRMRPLLPFPDISLFSRDIGQDDNSLPFCEVLEIEGKHSFPPYLPLSKGNSECFFVIRPLRQG